MDISNIPKTFWHSLSIAILIATIGLTIISYKSDSVSIEIASTKISLLSAIEETEKLNGRLRENNTKLKNECKEIVNIIRSFEKQNKNKIRDSSQKQSDKLESYNLFNLSDIKKFDFDKDFISDESFSKIQSRLNELRKNLQ